MTEVSNAVIRVFNDKFSYEAPKVLIFEHLGWDMEPQCAADAAVLREAWRLLCKPPAFAADQPRPADGPRWDQLLPAAPGLLRRLGWTVALRDNAAFVQTRDDVGGIRVVQVGWECFGLLLQWLHGCMIITAIFISKNANVFGKAITGRILPLPGVWTFRPHRGMRTSPSVVMWLQCRRRIRLTCGGLLRPRGALVGYLRRDKV